MDNNSTLQVVVIRYSKDCSWVKSLKVNSVVVINKSIDNIPEQTMKIPNIGGMEATVFQYIYNNYENLYDYYAFLQDDPFDDCSDIIYRINSLKNKNQYFTQRYWKDSKKHSYVLEKYNFTNEFIKDSFKLLFNEEYTDEYIFYPPNSQYMVSKEKILQRPKEFYLKCYDYITRTEIIYSPEAHFFERFTEKIFGFKLEDD